MRDMGVPRRLESNTFQSPLVRLLNTHSNAAFNGYRDSRVAVDYRMLTKQDALPGRETTRHDSRQGHEAMSLPVEAVSSRP
tara:strand:- start:1204 stop:1446 length:243 start_codon:yes stop_codon:yes gene_type:complete